MPRETSDSSGDHLAHDLPPAQRHRLEPLTAATIPRPAPLAVSRDAIRHWCEAFEDGHPPYLDAAAARRRGYRDCIAPLGAVLSTFVVPFAWPPPSAPVAAPARNLHHDVKEILGCPAAVVAAVSVEQPGHLAIGDRIGVSQCLLSVSAPKRTALGTGRFWKIERRYHAPDGSVAVRETMTSFGFDPATRVDNHARVIESADRSHTVAEQPLPELHMAITPVRAALVASATRDFAPVHIDPEYAQRVAGAAGAFMSREFHIGIACRLLTDWGAADSCVRRLDLALRRNLCVGDELTVRGHVTATRDRKDGRYVEVAVSLHAPHGIVSAGTALVEPGATAR